VLPGSVTCSLQLLVTLSHCSASGLTNCRGSFLYADPDVLGMYKVGIGASCICYLLVIVTVVCMHMLVGWPNTEAASCTQIRTYWACARWAGGSMVSVHLSLVPRVH
jgi:hypothetical protein